MADVVNLRTVRKQAKRQDGERRAQTSRLVHGQSKQTRKLDEARQSKASRDLDRHRIETGDRS